ncbi:PK beta-barrel-protein domain-containing protein-like protein [Mytilinidion resinicola]|uniref:PK beta-barrel-protein domain-containing protein-like protein n=1 Tax=Mytilinidion resinicola TaxID=574789 RepID=A0A6A6Y9I3_9PEZI|nr:PK beta-barrel-protein domain-containing protein-like protein [Mytilinidion resinicola]KAF2804644.1 PK beta-barrel-protein domain-containing protein-like protein [Mytilinidion resinicola]
MAVFSIFELEQPFQTEKLDQVRTGKVKKVFGGKALSAIYKVPHKEAIKVSKLGCEGDEHHYEFHGGPDKALLHYCSRHYDSWKAELPSSTHLFSSGGFGENLVSRYANERNICIGDILSIGEELIVQVSEPRAPCYKLNHRFEVKDMSLRCQTLARTGWLYRILQEGSIRPGDEIKMLKRLNPKWTVAAVQHYLYIEMNNVDMMKEIVVLEELGEDIKKIFRNRLNKKFEDQQARLLGDDSMVLNTWSEYRIAEKQMETPQIASFVLEAVEPAESPAAVQPGSHVRLKLGGKLVRAYSVIGGTENRFELGIAFDANSRGGSKFLHEKTKRGDTLTVGNITTSFPLSKRADHHIIIAGGIGITAFLAAAQFLESTGMSYSFHLAVASDVPFRRYLDPLGDKVTIYSKFQGNRMDIPTVLARGDDNTHVYCCGPERLMEGVTNAAEGIGLPKSNIHFETFQISASGDPFTADLTISKKKIEVDASKSLLDALRETGFDIPSSCEAGNCGTCQVTVCGGRIEHRGTGLTDEEKENTMLSCVSRGIGEVSLEL